MRVLVAIPTLNEVNTIKKTLDSIENCSFDKAVIVCDGNSKDGTVEIVQHHSLQPEIIYAGSYGDAIQQAFIYATQKNRNFDFVVIMDSESHNPIEMFDKLKTVKDTNVVVAGWRKNYSANVFRKLLTKTSRFYIHKLFKIAIIDPTSGFRAYPKQFVNEVKNQNALFQAPNYVINVNLALKLSRDNFEVSNFEMTYTGGQSKLTVKKLFQAMRWGFSLLFKGIN